MARIEIEVPRSFLTLLGIVGVISYLAWPSSPQQNVQADLIQGGSGDVPAVAVREAEEEGKALRVQQEVLKRREEILRYQLAILEEQNPTTLAEQREIDDARDHLLSLIADRTQAEREILASLQQIWEAAGYASLLSKGLADTGERTDMLWPIQPELGISAEFDDPGYQKRFGFAHQAVDIPAEQGSIVRAPAAGTVMKVTDQGLGFNSLVIRHYNGLATLYGHVSAFLVVEGQEVEEGEAIALSGGQPGTAGAGHLTTGPHLHFQVLKDGHPVDPMPYLPPL